MSIRFPEVEEVRLANPPIIEVVCQVRFPPILRISKEEPAEFQELIRGRFPQLDIRQEMRLTLPAAGNPNAPTADFQPRNYRFVTEDGQTTASLTSSFYALTSERYTHWHSFVEDLQLIHESFVQTYEPAHATRVGLRYINRLDVENTGTTERAELLDLLRPEISETLVGPVWQDAVEMATRTMFSDADVSLNARYAYEEPEGLPTLVLDFDCFEEARLPWDKVIARCNEFHSIIYRAFRWYIKEESLLRFEVVHEEA